MALADVHTKVVILLLFIHCCCCYDCVLGFCVGSLIIGIVQCVFSIFAIILLRKRERERAGCLLQLCSYCHVAVCALCVFLGLTRVGLQSVTVAFPGINIFHNAIKPILHKKSFFTTFLNQKLG